MSAITSISVRDALIQSLELLEALGKDLAALEDTPVEVLESIAIILAIGRAALSRETQ